MLEKGEDPCKRIQHDHKDSDPDDCLYGYKEDMLCLEKYLGTEAEVIISGAVDKISDHAFGENSALQSVVIPEGVKIIGQSAFYRCSALETVVFPNTLEEIDPSFFPEIEDMIDNVKNIDLGRYLISFKRDPEFAQKRPNYSKEDIDEYIGIIKYLEKLDTI